MLLWALGHTFDRHPRINRFVAGGRIYQRDGVWISFTAKTEMTEEGTLLEVKHRFDPQQPFADLVRELHDDVARARGGAEGLADRELDLFLHLPPSLRRAAVRLAGAANAQNLLPRAFIAGDPFFASAFVTNLGSVGLESAYHHLYEYGTIPLFCTLGAIHDEVVVQDGQPLVARVASAKFSFDEQRGGRVLRRSRPRRLPSTGRAARGCRLGPPRLIRAPRESSAPSASGEVA